MDPSTGNRRVYRLITALSEQRGWTSRLAIQQNTGIDRGTLARWRDGGGRKTDWFEKAERALELEPGTLARVRAGELDPEDLLAGAERPADRLEHAARSGEVAHGIEEMFRRDIEAIDRGHEAELTDLLVNQLRARGIRPEFAPPDQPPVDLMVTGPDGTTHLVEVKRTGDRTDGTYAAMGQLLEYARAFDPTPALWILIDRAPTEGEAETLATQGIRVLHPGDWSPLDLIKDTNQPANDDG